MFIPTTYFYISWYIRSTRSRSLTGTERGAPNPIPVLRLAQKMNIKNLYLSN